MGPIPCLKGCGFFGNPEQRDLCSQCYKDEILASAKASIHKQINREKEKEKEKEKDQDLMKAETLEASPPVIETVTKTRKRCGSCKKRIGLTGFSCKCGGEFCSSHRLPEMHHCSLDFKASGKTSIAKDNPVVKTEKLQKI